MLFTADVCSYMGQLDTGRGWLTPEKSPDDLEIQILILQGESHAETRWCWDLHSASSAPTSGLHRHRQAVMEEETGELYISSFQAPMFVASMTAKTGSLRSPTVKFTFSCLMRSIFSLTRALTFNSQSPTSQPRFRAGEESLRNICSFILILLCFQTDSPRHFCQPHPTGEGEG